MREVMRLYDNLIARGCHALVIEDAATTTVQPLTRLGHDAIYSMLKQLDAPTHLLAALGKKKRGHYYAAVPLQATGEAVARVLIADHSLPDGSAVIYRAGVELPVLRFGDETH